ncbi:MAG: ankyrin repeat domain-containing protein [Proteobacteria bacterium]|nr:ankyrin repeat domain-containing protein [Pseudomonadota bacterium]
MSSSDLPLSFLLSGDHKGKYPQQLVARFPHVARRLDELWNDPAGVGEYFSELMVSSRPNRQGFPPEVAAEIMSLCLAYERIGQIKPMVDEQPHGAVVVSDPWETERAQRELQRQGIDLSVANFVRAAEAGDAELCRLFIHAGLDVDARDSRHWTPLLIAAFNGNEKLALELLRYGADMHATDLAGYTPLHWAGYNGYPKVVQLLLVKGLPADVASNAGITPLLQAAARGHREVVATLLRHQANPNLAARDGSTALLKAVANGHLEVIDLLLKAGASVEVTMQDGKTLREIARNAKDPAIAARIAAAPRGSAGASGLQWPKGGHGPR